MSHTVDAEGRIEHEDISYDDRVGSDAPALVPEVYRYQSRNDEAQGAHGEIKVPVEWKSIEVGVSDT